MAKKETVKSSTGNISGAESNNKVPRTHSQERYIESVRGLNGDEAAAEAATEIDNDNQNGTPKSDDYYRKRRRRNSEKIRRQTTDRRTSSQRGRGSRTRSRETAKEASDAAHVTSMGIQFHTDNNVNTATCGVAGVSGLRRVGQGLRNAFKRGIANRAQRKAERSNKSKK